jgi:outer membrane lipase/esterase
MFRPFAKVVWNHELADTDRLMTASLTTTVAPSYSLPAIELGKDWATGTIGTTITWPAGITGIVSFTGQVGQGGVVTYGGQVGFNVAL